MPSSTLLPYPPPPGKAQCCAPAVQASVWLDPDGTGPFEYKLVYRLGTQTHEAPASATAGWSTSPTFTFATPATSGNVTFLMYVRDAQGAVSQPARVTVLVTPVAQAQVVPTLQSYPLADPVTVTPEQLRVAAELLPQVPPASLDERLRLANNSVATLAAIVSSELPPDAPRKAYFAGTLAGLVTAIPQVCVLCVFFASPTLQHAWPKNARLAAAIAGTPTLALLWCGHAPLRFCYTPSSSPDSGGKPTAAGGHLLASRCQRPGGFRPLV